MSRLRLILRSVDPVDATAIVGLVVLAVGIAGQFSVYAAAIAVGALLLVYAVLATRSAT